MAQPPSSTDVLRSLHLLRSTDASERKQAVTVLSHMLDDPRVLQVFEYLYEKDPDPTVREQVWRAINRSGPSIPAPSVPAPTTAKPPSGKTATGGLFLLNPANGKRGHSQPRGRPLAWIAGGLLLLAVVGVIWGLVLPDWATWNNFRRSGVETLGEITDLKQRDGRYYVLYRFAAPDDDVVYTGEQRVNESTFNSVTLDMLPAVTYLPDNPHVSRLDAYNPDDTVRDRLTILAGGLTLLALILVGIGGVQGLSRRTQVIKGQIVSCTGYRDRDGNYKLKLSYRFRAPDGKVIAGQIAQVRNDLKNASLPAKGAPVAVAYRSKQSHRLL